MSTMAGDGSAALVGPVGGAGSGAGQVAGSSAAAEVATPPPVADGDTVVLDIERKDAEGGDVHQRVGGEVLVGHAVTAEALAGSRPDDGPVEPEDIRYRRRRFVDGADERSAAAVLDEFRPVAPLVPPALRSEMNERFYGGSIRELERLTGLDLSVWRHCPVAPARRTGSAPDAPPAGEDF